MQRKWNRVAARDRFCYEKTLSVGSPAITDSFVLLFGHFPERLIL